MAMVWKNFMAFLVVALALTGCARKPTSTADIPRLLPHAYTVAVAPFTQPTHGGQLITGQIPEFQGQVPQDVLTALDMDLREVLLNNTKRQYDFLPGTKLKEELAMARTTGQPSGLGLWTAYARRHKADFLLIPMILDWHDREGSEAGVQKSAYVRLEMFLLNARTGQIQERTVFEEKQVGLVDNLLGVKDFFRRRGQWVTSRQLAKEGMESGVKEMGL